MPPPSAVQESFPVSHAAPSAVPLSRSSWLKRMLRFAGPGYLVAVGYMDPGNWATDLAGGSAYGYTLLWIVALSSVMAIFLQVLAARLGIASGLDLAQACRAHSAPRTVVPQWLLCEVAICACDLAEVIGTAIAFKLLFGIPLTWGVALTVLDVFLVLWLQRRGFRYLECVIVSLLAVVTACFGLSLVVAQPQLAGVLAGFVPSKETITNPGMLYVAIGIVGATVMPHNLYLHSSIVQSRDYVRDDAGKRQAMGFATVDIVGALVIAFFINAAILISAAAIFHVNGHHDVADLQDASELLGPITGVALASTVFGIALLASGLSSAVTATLAGQIVMEGFVRLRMPPWARRLLTRSLAIVPAFFVALLYGEAGVTKLLLLSQVVLSLQLPFAMVPLIRFTSSRKVMGRFANRPAVLALAIAIASFIIALNGVLLWRLWAS
ncbi:Nramp family divalent metal transporter [Variovorax sp. H27-G14]|uniref:Nramp family divalent metal transporter n=1 Tax=Variovorax sp. H27-G14 TaxID=3111914 RepID=UPI0038FCDB16